MTPGGKIRVLVVDDSAFMRKVLNGIISSDPQLDVCGEAKDGREAVEQAEALKPDVISMDINMPRMDGLEATEIVMSKNPRPILIVSSESRDGAEVTLKALQLGAIDFVAKPSGGIDLDMSSVSEEICRKLKMASKVRVVRTATRVKTQESGDPAARAERAPAPPLSQRGLGKVPIVVVACSTGGPATLMKMVPELPQDFPAAVLLVQHMPGNYTGQFAMQLGEVAQVKVKEAEAGEIILPGQLYVCPGACHMRISTTGRIVLEEGPRVSGYRPCADITLESAADYSGPNTVGVVLTGMGNDGAKGVQAVKAAGGHVIAQDESTAVIFGMPQESIKTGAVDEVLPLEAISAAIEKQVLRIFSEARVGAR
jgi:two-component system chemotaxis response regulator CheB